MKNRSKYENVVNALEKMKERTKKTSLSLRRMSKEMRLDRMGLTKLSKRVEEGDMIEMFKLVNELELGQKKGFFSGVKTE